MLKLYLKLKLRPNLGLRLWQRARLRPKMRLKRALTRLQENDRPGQGQKSSLSPQMASLICADPSGQDSQMKGRLLKHEK